MRTHSTLTVLFACCNKRPMSRQHGAAARHSHMLAYVANLASERLTIVQDDVLQAPGSCTGNSAVCRATGPWEATQRTSNGTGSTATRLPPKALQPQRSGGRYSPVCGTHVPSGRP
jgi:hypothetical protein